MYFVLLNILFRHFKGPGQYIDPKKPQLNNRGQQLRSVCGIKFTESTETRDLAKPNAAKEPGPGQYIDPMKFGRGPDGEVSFSPFSSSSSSPSLFFS